MRSPAELYDWELAHVARDRARRLDLPFYAELAARTGGPVLELACGTGRLTAHLSAVGLDIDPAMLAVARRRGVARLVCADMRRFRLACRFGLVAVPYNSLQLLGSDEEIVASLRVAAEHLAPGGLLALEVGDFQAGATRDAVAPELLAEADGVRLYGALVHDRAGRTTTYHRRFEQDGAAHVDHVRLRCLDRAELEGLFHQARLGLVEARKDGHRLFAVGAPEPARVSGG
ncbi:MAG TPA: class I SAM-dependent methyltransferase [Acidimicrobiales bacterium]|nr:class I SAM-dependent methyltransferase [Acidimicrobiales bacterium]